MTRRTGRVDAAGLALVALLASPVACGRSEKPVPSKAPPPRPVPSAAAAPAEEIGIALMFCTPPATMRSLVPLITACAAKCTACCDEPH